MKYLIIFTCLVVASFAELAPEIKKMIKDHFHKLKEECKTEVDVSDDDLEPLINHEPPNTENGKCFVACVSKKLHIQDKDGKLSEEAALEKLEHMKEIDEDLFGNIKSVLETCFDKIVDDENECETAANMFTCIKKEKKARGMEEED